MFDELLPADSVNFVWSSVNGRVLAPNEEVRAIQLNPADARRVGRIIQNMTFEVCYCSVYDACWTTDLTRETVPVDACTADTDLNFVQ